MGGIKGKALNQLMQMETPQILDLLVGLEQRPETNSQLVQLIAHIANEEKETV